VGGAFGNHFRIVQLWYPYLSRAHGNRTVAEHFEEVVCEPPMRDIGGNIERAGVGEQYRAD